MKVLRSLCAFVLASILTLVHASQLPRWVEVASDEGWVGVHADAPLDSLDWFSLGALAGTRLRAEVFVDGGAAVEADAIAAVALLLDAAHAWASFQPPGSAHAPGAAVHRGARRHAPGRLRHAVKRRGGSCFSWSMR